MIFITFQQSFPSKRKRKYIGLTSWWISESAQCVLSPNFPKSIQSNLKHCALASLQCIFGYFSTLNIHKGNLNIIFNPHLEICCEKSQINQSTHFISTIKREKLSTVFKINLYPHFHIIPTYTICIYIVGSGITKYGKIYFSSLRSGISQKFSLIGFHGHQTWKSLTERTLFLVTRFFQMPSRHRVS